MNNFRDRVLIMEYCEHGSLRRFLKGQGAHSRLTERQSLEVLYQCLQALAHLHERNVAHRDITPANILFRSVSPVDVALADFGWAKETEDPMSSFQAGTPLYRAPEMALKERRFDKSVDVWSLGVVAMECLFGLPTFIGNGSDIACAIIRHMETRTPDESQSARLIRDMLRRNPNKRPSAQRCLREVENTLKCLPLASHGPSSGPDGTSNSAPSPPVSSRTTARQSGRLASGLPPGQLSNPDSTQCVTALHARLHPAFPVTPVSSGGHVDKNMGHAARPDTPLPQSIPARECGTSGTALDMVGGPLTSRKRPAEDDGGGDEHASEKPESKRRAMPRRRNLRSPT